MALLPGNTLKRPRDLRQIIRDGHDDAAKKRADTPRDARHMRRGRDVDYILQL